MPSRKLFETALAGMIPENGRLGAMLPTGQIVYPGGEIGLRKDRIFWSFDFDRVKSITPPDGLLDDFVQLWRSEDAVVLKFARKWGPLRIASSGDLSDGRHGSESLDAWRFFSRRAYSVIRLSGALHGDRRGDPQDWSFLSSDANGDPRKFFGMPNWALRGMVEGLPMPPANDVPFPADRLRDQIAGELTEWMNRYGVKLRARWGEVPNLEISFGNLLGAIAVQLTLAVMRMQGAFNCAGCGKLDTGEGRDRRAKIGQRNFCKECGRPEALRQAKGAHRERIAQARSLHAEGIDPAAIANKLGVRKVSTVEGWIKKGKSNV